MRQQVLGDALGEKLGVNSPEKGFGNVLQGKGGFWVKGKGFYTLAQARKITGIEAPKRQLKEKLKPWGDYATIAMLNQPKKKQPKDKTFRRRRKF